MRRVKRYGRLGMVIVLTGVLGLTGCQNPLLGIGTQGRPLVHTELKTKDPSEVTETVTVLPEDQELTKLSVRGHVLIVEEGKERAIEALLTPEDACLYRITYESADLSVCTVRQDGVVTGVAEGETKVYIRDSISGLQTEIKIQVKKEILPAEIQLSQTELELGLEEQAELEATVLPEDAENRAVVWSSSDEKIAVVDENGVITAVAAGTCTITAQAHADESIRAEIAVTVSEKKPAGNGTAGGSPAGNGGSSSGSGGSSGGSGSSSGSSSSGSGGSSGSSSSSSGGGSTGGSSAAAYYNDGYAEQVLALVNARRAEAGVAPLTMNYTLVSASKVRAAEISQYFSHTRPNGSSCFTAYDEAGVSYWGAGENIAAGQWSPDSVMNSWMNSPGHKANILDGSFTQIGIACYYDPNSDYGYYWVQNFIY